MINSFAITKGIVSREHDRFFEAYVCGPSRVWRAVWRDLPAIVVYTDFVCLNDRIGRSGELTLLR